MYGGNLINYDVNSSNLKSTLTPEIFQNITSYNDNELKFEEDDYHHSNSDFQVKMTYLNDSELDEKIKTASDDLLYVSSFTTNTFNNIFNFDIYYNIS